MRDDVRHEALAAARGLAHGESALAGVLRDLEQERSRAAEAYHAVVRSLAAALEARDGYTGEHSDDVHALSLGVARRLGLDASAVAEVETVALLHDIGKIGVPDAVLHKPGGLDAAEWTLMREHPVIGERILRPLAGLSAVATAVRHEHERWDGTGYPDGLSGAAIPLASRIVLACDAYHALVSDRPYRRALSDEHARSELRGGAGTQFDPAVVDALEWCLEHPEEVDAAREPATVSLVAHDHGARLERELQALIAIASSVGAAHRVEDVVEVAAERACEAVGAASLSVSRWEVERRLLRTMVNAGTLGPGEERLPVDEVYKLHGDDEVLRRIEEGDTFFVSLGDPDVDPLERRLLEQLGKEHCIGVPIMYAGTSWGELWATRTVDQPPFDAQDARFLHTVAGQIAAGVGRAEVFSRMSELAFEDPLTGVANRRRLDERLELAVAEAVERGADVAVLLCDVDELKELNDHHGHQTGDLSLSRVAETLVAEAGPDALVARIGGDEFCVLLEGRTAEEARAIGEGVLARLAVPGDGPVLSVSCGVASLALGPQRSGDLLRAADAAQYQAKRSGRARVCVVDPDGDGSWRSSSADRRAIRSRPVDAPPRGLLLAPSGADLGTVLASATTALDGPLRAKGAGERLEAVAMAIGGVVDATGVAVSWHATGTTSIVTDFSCDRRAGTLSGRRYGVEGAVFAASEFPASERLMTAGGQLLVHVEDPDADPAERRLLDVYGMTGMLAAGVPGAGGVGWLVEVFADPATAALGPVSAALRLLAGEAVRGAAPAEAPAAPAEVPADLHTV